jgi:TetR/AcrR family transcriptional repressor of nem operon
MRFVQEGPILRYPASETAEKHGKIVKEAARLFREDGLSGVAISDIMKGADLTHGSFYNHFASKQALISECVACVGATAIAQMQAHEPSAAGKGSFVSQYLSLMTRDDPGAACLMSSLSAEIARQPPLRRSMTGYVQSFIGKLASHFPWPAKVDARRDAIRTMSALVGALMLARSVDDETLSAEILREVASGLKHPPLNA